MAGINVSSLGSGIDFSVVTDSIIAQRSRPLRQLAAQQSALRTRNESLRELNTRVSRLSSAVKALTDASAGSGRSVASSSATVATASASGSATVGTFALDVTRVATRSSQASVAFSSSNNPVLAGGATTATFELRKGGAATGPSITISTASNSLTGLRDAINGANAGVTAAILDTTGDGTQNRLVLTSNDTGVAGRVELVETTATGTAAALGLQELNVANVAQLNAEFKVNGLTVTRSSNAVSDAVAGVTLSLKATGQTQVTVNADTAPLRGRIVELAEAFNAVQDFVADQFKPNAQGRPSGALAGDSTLRTTLEQLRNVFNQPGGSSNGIASFGDLGLDRDASGKISIDTQKLNDQLANQAADVVAFFTGTSDQIGAANRFQSTTQAVSQTITSAINGNNDTVRQLDRSITSQQDRLGALRDSLTRRFAAIDAAIGQINGQGEALSNIVKTLNPDSRN
jgi:flagellar hook-associated protein 2